MKTVGRQNLPNLTGSTSYFLVANFFASLWNRVAESSLKVDSTPAQVSEQTGMASVRPEDGISRFHNPAARLVRCSDPKNDSQRSPLCGVWASPSSFESGLAQILVNHGLTDCIPTKWNRSDCPADLVRLWEPLPPPGYSPFERFFGRARPENMGPFEFMIQTLATVAIDEYRDPDSGTLSYFEAFTQKTRPGLVARHLKREDIACVFGIDFATFECLERFVADAYLLVYTRKFRRPFYDYVRPLHQAGHQICLSQGSRYVHEYLRVCQGYSSPKLPTCSELRKKHRCGEDLRAMFHSYHNTPLKYISIYFGTCWTRIMPLPIRATVGELGVLLSHLKPAGRAYVSEFFNRTNYLPSIIYAQWVDGYVGAQGDEEQRKAFRSLEYRLPNFQGHVEEGPACASACSKQAIGPVRLSSLIERKQVGLAFPEQDVLVTVPVGDATPQAPSITLGMCPNLKTIVHTGSQIYYRESRDGITRHIPLTRYPTREELESRAFLDTVDKAFATSTDAYAPSNAAYDCSRACHPSMDSCNANWLNPAYSASAGGSAFTSA